MTFDRCCWLFVLWFSLAPAGAQPYGLDSRPSVGPFLNGQLPTTGAENFPALLSQTGAFTDTAVLIPAATLLPYTVNTALWSDGAAKWRWAAVPTNGTIGFAPKGAWTFPSGTVFVKHFELPLNETNPAVRKRLETRFLIRTSLGTVFGVTYKWRADNSDADLLTNSLTENVVIQTPAGTRKQRWYYPSREDCLACHTAQAGYLLGPKTAQLNGDFNYTVTGVTDNQLRVWNHLGLFTTAIDEQTIAGLPKMFSVTDATASLEQRARSYLDANCAHCHRPGGTAHANWDGRFDTPLAEQGLINAPVIQGLGIDGVKLIAPGDADRSMIHSRTERLDLFKMPPLAKNLVDPEGEPLVEAWINSLPRAGGPYKLVAAGADWNYLDDGSDPGLTWPQADFNDSTWSIGPAKLGFGQGDESTEINGGPVGDRFVTTYFRKRFIMTDAMLCTNLAVRLLRDDGAVVYLNGREIFRSNLPDGLITTSTLASTDITGLGETIFVEAALNPAQLIEGTNALAVEVHQSSRTSDDLGFDLELPAYLRAARLNTPPRLDLSQFAAGDRCFRLQGQDEQAYIIDVSSNLVQWLPRWTNYPSGGVFEFVEPETDVPVRFYRARLWP